MLDQLARLLSIPGSDDVFASLPQNCKELVNGAALAEARNDSESVKMLLDLSGGEPILNVTSVKTIQTGAGRNTPVASRTCGRLLTQQNELPHLHEAVSAGSVGWLAGANHCKWCTSCSSPSILRSVSRALNALV